MGYLSFDCSCKIHASGKYTSTKRNTNSGNNIMKIDGYIRHIAREVDRKNGCEVNHSNQDIKPDLTLENESYYKDENGEWQRATKSKDIVNAINRRIEYARENGARISTKGKNDTVIVRPLVLQLGNDSIIGHEDTWVWDLISILESEEIGFGKDNICGVSAHKDEKNWHLHVCFTPVVQTEKTGKMKASINQTHYFSSPRQLASLHRQIRKKLLDKGYTNIEQENKSIDEALAGYYDKDGKFHQQGLAPTQLKELSAKKNYLEKRCIDMDMTYKELMMMNQNMSEMMKSSKDRQEEMEKEREKEHEDFLFQQTALENDKANVQAQLQALLLREMDVQKRELEADEMLESAYATAEICNQILSDQTTLNPDFLDFLEREGKKREKPFRKFVEIWYENFLNEYKDKISDDNSNLQMELKHRMDNCSKVKKMTVRNLPYLKNEDSTYTCGLFQ